MQKMANIKGQENNGNLAKKVISQKFDIERKKYDKKRSSGRSNSLKR
jgi:hypothetical protein